MKQLVVIFFLVIVSLFGKDTLNLAMLEKIPSNTMLGFKMNNRLFYCSQYGVYGLDRFVQQKVVEGYCKDSIDKVQKRHPSYSYFGQSQLSIKQRYHVTYIEGECKVYSAGAKTYAEVLVEAGLGVVKPKFKKRDYYYYLLQKAQKRAKISKRGIWSEFGIEECVQSLYKE